MLVEETAPHPPRGKYVRVMFAKMIKLVILQNGMVLPNLNKSVTNSIPRGQV